jgi:hypothetical protein
VATCAQLGDGVRADGAVATEHEDGERMVRGGGGHRDLLVISYKGVRDK